MGFTAGSSDGKELPYFEAFRIDKSEPPRRADVWRAGVDRRTWARTAPPTPATSRSSRVEGDAYFALPRRPAEGAAAAGGAPGAVGVECNGYSAGKGAGWFSSCGAAPPKRPASTRSSAPAAKLGPATWDPPKRTNPVSTNLEVKPTVDDAGLVTIQLPKNRVGLWFLELEEKNYMRSAVRRAGALRPLQQGRGAGRGVPRASRGCPPGASRSCRSPTGSWPTPRAAAEARLRHACACWAARTTSSRSGTACPSARGRPRRRGETASARWTRRKSLDPAPRGDVRRGDDGDAREAKAGRGAADIGSTASDTDAGESAAACLRAALWFGGPYERKVGPVEKNPCRCPSLARAVERRTACGTLAAADSGRPVRRGRARDSAGSIEPRRDGRNNDNVRPFTVPRLPNGPPRRRVRERHSNKARRLPARPRTIATPR